MKNNNNVLISNAKKYKKTSSKNVYTAPIY